MSSQSASTNRPYLSVVAASRNDDHGGDPLSRTQIFISTFARQCEQHRLHGELILIDWNPVPGRPGLAGVLQLPAEATYCTARVITVPHELHTRFKYSDRLQFFQMIAKNAGIRRARGEFILATNIDIIFSDELFRFLASRALDPHKTYRVDRYDIESGMSADLSVDETMAYAWSHPVRSNPRRGPHALAAALYGEDKFRRHCAPEATTPSEVDGAKLEQHAGIWSVQPPRDTGIDNLHTNACGDFTLLSRAGWDAITGYPEFEAFSMNIDSAGLAAAHYAGYEEVALLPPCVCFHIEHSLGSGWTPEGEKKLFARLAEKKILNPDWEVLLPLVEAQRNGEAPAALNGPTWGLAEFDLPEEILPLGEIRPTPPHPRPYNPPTDRKVCALLPEFDLDYLVALYRHTSKRLNQRVAAVESALEQTVGFLRAVEKDAADRLEAITFYQDKLKQAYADHAHNVAFIEGQDALLQEHVRVAAERDGLITQLNAQVSHLTATAQATGDLEGIRRALEPFGRNIHKVWVARYHPRLLPHILWLAATGTAVEVFDCPPVYAKTQRGAVTFHQEI